ncbi:MAG: hypothetical protein ACKVP7_20835 [Hyphomicrobiaceae bacterium]
MDTNKLLGLALLMTGIMDIVIVRMMGPKLAPAVRTAITTFGLGFLMLGVAVTFGVIKLA